MDDPLLTPSAYLRAGGRHVQPEGDVVLAFDLGVVPRPGVAGRLRHRLRRSPVTARPFRAAHALGGGVDLVVASPGRPMAGTALELLGALGVRRVVSIGTAAALVPLDIGGVGIVARAVSDGERLRYPSQADGPDPALAGRLERALGAPHVVAFTTDVPFRQTAAVLDAARRDAQVLEMECDALFQVGDALGVAVASVVVVSDHYDGATWEAGEPALAGTRLRVLVDEVAAVLRATR